MVIPQGSNPSQAKGPTGMPVAQLVSAWEERRHLWHENVGDQPPSQKSLTWVWPTAERLGMWLRGASGHGPGPALGRVLIHTQCSGVTLSCHSEHWRGPELWGGCQSGLGPTYRHWQIMLWWGMSQVHETLLLWWFSTTDCDRVILESEFLRHILWVSELQRLVISSHLQCTRGPVLKVHFTWLHLLALQLSGGMAITPRSNFKKEVMIFQVIINKNAKQEGRAWITHRGKLPRQKIMCHK